jgi:NADH:ubiquinone oxidoreductase subunit 6 (subunit J)
MKERYFRSKYITRLQQTAWYLFLFCFAVATAFYFLGYPQAEIISYWGIVLILLITSIVIVTIGEQFRKTNLFRFWLLCYMLIVILLSVIIAKVYFYNG